MKDKFVLAVRSICKKENKRKNILVKSLAIIFIFGVCFHSNNAFADTKPEKHVLIVNPFTQDYPGSQLYIKGIKSALEKKSDFKFSYSYEYADLGRHSNDEEYLENLSEYLKAKYSNDQPDFIITAITLYSFFSKHGDDIFPNVPVIVDWDKEEIPTTPIPTNYTIISQLPGVDENIQVILRTKPSTQKIYMVVGNSINERNISKSILDVESKYSNQVEFELLNNLSYADMIKTIKGADDNSVILYFQWYSDINGKGFIPVEVVKTICQEAKVPVYGASAQYLGSGVIGGYVGSQELVGQTAGDIVLDMLNEKKALGNQVVRAKSRVYTFDWKKLKEWKIDEDKLPPDSIILNKDMSVWQLYKGYIIGAFILVTVQAVLIFVLLIHRRKRRKAESELMQANISLQAMTEKLISIDKMKDEFLVNTSHELQTPLNGLINISETLSEGKYGEVNEKQREELQVILAVSRKLSLLIKDIIDLEKIKRDDMEINLKVVDIKSASEIVAEVLRHLIQSKNIEILLDIPEKLSPVLADENRLLQILYNLVGNGVKFTEKGTVKLCAKEDGEFVKIIITDTGIGVSKEKQQKLFHAFTQAETDISRQYGGSGLGLYISQQLLERMGGKIFLEWSEPQKGTCISFLIPKTIGEPVNKRKAFNLELDKTKIVINNTEDKLSRNFKILAVDDEPTNLRVLKSILDNDEYEVLTAQNGIEAIEVLKRNNDIDLVLMDVMMQGMSGYEACRKIRVQYTLHDLPILILTVRNTIEDIEIGFDSGANDFVTKPFVAKELRARVSNLLQMKKSVQEALKNEMAFLQSQIKPHFLYNAISTIMSFCYTDGPRAGELLAYLSEYLQKSFTIDNTKTTVSLENELKLTKAYTEIEKARFGERLKVEYDLDETLMKQRILPLIIQPLVENSIRHGLMKRKSGGTVKVAVKRVIDGIKISVEDNGMGIENTEAIMKTNLSSKGRNGGVGILNIKGRLMKYYGSELYLDSKIDIGTKVYFTLNI